MAFEIKLEKNNSEANRVTKDVSFIVTLTGELKTETSIIDPVFVVEYPLEHLTNCNYVTIPAFGRSYFVNNIRSIRTGLVELTCHVDVLSSFAEEIKANKAIVRRQESQWNLYINDGTFRVYQNPNVLTKAFPSGFDTQEFVLAIAGGAQT